MKKAFKAIICLFLLFVSIPIAKGYYCYYSFTFADGCSDALNTYGAGLTINKDTKSFEFDEDARQLLGEAGISDRAGFGVLDLYLSKNLNIENPIDVLQGTCPEEVLVYKKNGIISSPDIPLYLLLFNASYEAEIHDNAEFSFVDSSGEVKKLWIDSRAAKGVIVPEESYDDNGVTGDKNPHLISENILFECKKYNEYIERLRKVYCDTTNPNNNCTSFEIMTYKNYKDEVIDYCSRLLGFGNYINPCVKNCLNLGKDIYAIDGNGIMGDCTFSDRLINWVRNIIRWIKYILPVVIIVLSIIDFIKAIASEKEEEMKKAQSHFARRLIIAAILFLVPLIIEFILDKMGFATNLCGLWG